MIEEVLDEEGFLKDPNLWSEDLAKKMAEKANLADSLSTGLQRKLSSFEHSYPDHWVVTATTRDGRRFSRVVIGKRFLLESEAVLPFKLRDIADVAWEGFAGVPVGPVVQLSDGRSSAV